MFCVLCSSVLVYACNTALEGNTLAVYSIRTGKVVLLCNVHLVTRSLYIFNMDPIMYPTYDTFRSMRARSSLRLCILRITHLFFSNDPLVLLLSNSVSHFVCVCVCVCTHVYVYVCVCVCVLYMDVTCVYLKHATFNYPTFSTV